MKHAIIVAHPKGASFTGTLASAYSEAVQGQGHGAVIRDLYRMRFDPCLAESEWPWSEDAAPRQDVVAEREMLRDVDVFALFYPYG